MRPPQPLHRSRRRPHVRSWREPWFWTGFLFAAGLVLGFAVAWSVSYHFPAGTICVPPRP